VTQSQRFVTGAEGVTADELERGGGVQLVIPESYSVLELTQAGGQRTR
jgi:hypothetical protein